MIIDLKNKKTKEKKSKSRSQYLQEWRQKNPDQVKANYERDKKRKRWRYANNDEYRQRILDERKKRHDDPEFRNKRTEYMREYRKRNKIKPNPTEPSEKLHIGWILDQIMGLEKDKKQEKIII